MTSENTGTISAIDVATATLIKTIKVGRRPRSVAFLPDSSRAYVNAENDGAVIVVDTVEARSHRDHLARRARSHQTHVRLALPRRRTLYVSTGRGHKLFVIDTASNKIMASLEVGERPWGITLSPDAKTLSAKPPPNDVAEVTWEPGVTKKLRSVTDHGEWSLCQLKGANGQVC